MHGNFQSIFVPLALAIAVALAVPPHRAIAQVNAEQQSQLQAAQQIMAEAVEMLLRLSGREHEVHTGIAVAQGGRIESGLERVRVRFRPLDRDECEAYVATGEPMDKAGAYGIQGYGSAIVERIDGDFFAVMGLPVVRMLALIEKFGWRYSFGSLKPV